MTIPAGLTHAEVGALLVAVGRHMIDWDVCAEAVLDPMEGTDRSTYFSLLAGEMVLAHSIDDLDRSRAQLILTHLTLQEAIQFVDMDSLGFKVP